MRIEGVRPLLAELEAAHARTSRAASSLASHCAQIAGPRPYRRMVQQPELRTDALIIIQGQQPAIARHLKGSSRVRSTVYAAGRRHHGHRLDDCSSKLPTPSTQCRVVRGVRPDVSPVFARRSRADKRRFRAPRAPAYACHCKVRVCNRHFAAIVRDGSRRTRARRRRRFHGFASAPLRGPSAVHAVWIHSTRIITSFGSLRVA